MYEVKNELAPMITAIVFCATPENDYNLRHHNDFRVPFVYHSTEKSQLNCAP